MLPANHHPHDAKWIASKLLELPHDLRGPVCAAYSAAHAEAYEAEPVEHKKDGAARRSANSRLLSFVTRITNNHLPPAQR